MSSGINPQVYIWKSCLGTNTGGKLRKWLPWTGLIHLVHRLRCMLVKTAWQHLPLCTNDFHQKAYHNPVERMRCWKSNEQPLGNRQQPYPRASWTRKTSRASTHLLQFMEKQASCPANLTNHWRGSQFSGARKAHSPTSPVLYKYTYSTPNGAGQYYSYNMHNIILIPDLILEVPCKHVPHSSSSAASWQLSKT